jgi:hypothetical protein
MPRAVLATAVAAVATMIVCPSLARAAPTEEPPQLDYDHPVQCLTDGESRVWRVQCNEDTKLCVYAPSHELDEDGTWTRQLERTRGCDTAGPFDQQALRAQGYQLVAGLADAPRGWMRDRRGRVFQVTFDLHRRLYAGVSWAPSQDDASRATLDFGLFEYEHTSGDARSGLRHRLRLVEGSVQLAPFGADATLVHYDFSRRSVIPLVRITTFWGTPRRYDIGAHVGAWMELGRVEIDEVAPEKHETLWRYATLHATWDVWRSARDMSSFVRLRAGAGVERAVVDPGAGIDRDAITPAGAVEADLTLDDDGFHHVTALAQVERPQFTGDARELRHSATRAQTRLAYEVILVAINDQPLTLRVAGEAEYRNDQPDVAHGWELRALAGLRLSLWAPAR